MIVRPATHVLTLPGPMLRRGFWLYVWRVETPEGELLYVGRTGDNSSPFAAAPYQRMGQHLGRVKSQKALRTHLEKRGVSPEDCASFELICHGPIHAEIPMSDRVGRAVRFEHHRPLRNSVGAMEKALADDLRAAEYKVLNTVNCNWKLDHDLWAPVRAAFAERFEKLNPKATA